jgi:thioredoxin 1
MGHYSDFHNHTHSPARWRRIHKQPSDRAWATFAAFPPHGLYRTTCRWRIPYRANAAKFRANRPSRRDEILDVHVLDHYPISGNIPLYTQIQPLKEIKPLLAHGFLFRMTRSKGSEIMNLNCDKQPTVEVDERNFVVEVLRSKQPVLVAFWAQWSLPCRVLDPVLDEVAIACAGSVKVAKVNADDNPDLSLWFDVQSVPTLLHFVSGKLRARIVGTATKETILSKLESPRKAL